MGDIEFLAKKEFDGKLVHNSGTVTTTTDVATLTASTGKDMYLAKAHIIGGATSSSGGLARVLLKANGVTIGEASIELRTGTSINSGSSSQNYEFAMTGIKVTTGQIIKLEVTSITNCSISGELVCFEEDTGTDPSIIAQSLTVNATATNAGDILALAKKEFDGKLRSDEGFLSTTGDLATLTANTGKDMYLTAAKVVYFLNTGSTAIATADEVVLKVNGTVVETSKASLGRIDTAAGAQSTVEYEFKNIGHKVSAGQIIKLEVITLDTETDVEGFIQCFEEDTGTTPAS